MKKSICDFCGEDKLCHVSEVKFLKAEDDSSPTFLGNYPCHIAQATICPKCVSQIASENAAKECLSRDEVFVLYARFIRRNKPDEVGAGLSTTGYEAGVIERSLLKKLEDVYKDEIIRMRKRQLSKINRQRLKYEKRKMQ
jgi:hypothetical protein